MCVAVRAAMLFTSAVLLLSLHQVVYQVLLTDSGGCVGNGLTNFSVNVLLSVGSNARAVDSSAAIDLAETYQHVY